MKAITLFSLLVALLFLSLIADSNASTTACGTLKDTIDDARAKLKQASFETDFDAARNHARSAKNALHQAASGAIDCRCDEAFMEFDTAAARARRARDVDDPREFVEYLNQVTRSFNSAIEALNSCAVSVDRNTARAPR